MLGHVVGQVVAVQATNSRGRDGRQGSSRDQVEQHRNVPEQQVQVQDRDAVGGELGQCHGQIGGQDRLARATAWREDNRHLPAYVAGRRADFLAESHIHRGLTLDHDAQHAAHHADAGGDQHVEIVFA